MAAHELLKQVQLFAGLTTEELKAVAALITERQIAPGEIIIEQNTTGTRMFVVADGSVEVFVSGYPQQRSLVVLGHGQVFGEMALLDHGFRSASVRGTEEGCICYEIESDSLEGLCEENEHIGYAVMRNLASELAFKLRHGNLAAT